MNEFAAAARNAQQLLQSVMARRMPRTLRTLSQGFAAFTAGGRTIPLGDNGELLKDLAARAGDSVRSSPLAC
jgi:hypothetical protein